MSAKPTYLGDGVYANCDGYYIGLSVNSHNNPTVVLLEDEVIAKLVAYALPNQPGLRKQLENLLKE